MTYPPQQPQGDWGGQQPYGPPQQGYGQPAGYDQQYGDYQQPHSSNPYSSPPADAYSSPPAEPYPQYQPTYPYGQPAPDPYAQQYSAPPVSVAPASGQPWGPGTGPMMPPPAPKSGPPAWVFIVGGLVLLAMIGVGVFFVVATTGDDRPSDDKSDSADDKSDEPSDDPTDEPDSDLIFDENTKLGFEPMDGWDPIEGSSFVPNFVSFTGQQYEVKSNWVAVIGVGEIDAAAVGYKDSGDLEDAAKNLAEVYDKSNFGSDPKGLDRDKKAEYHEEKLAGKDAVTMVYHLTWDEGENPDTGEQIVIAAIDIGGGKVAGFLGSLPDSTPKSQVDKAVEAADSLAFT